MGYWRGGPPRIPWLYGRMATLGGRGTNWIPFNIQYHPHVDCPCAARALSMALVCEHHATGVRTA